MANRMCVHAKQTDAASFVVTVTKAHPANEKYHLVPGTHKCRTLVKMANCSHHHLYFHYPPPFSQTYLSLSDPASFIASAYLSPAQFWDQLFSYCLPYQLSTIEIAAFVILPDVFLISNNTVHTHLPNFLVIFDRLVFVNP